MIARFSSALIIVVAAVVSVRLCYGHKYIHFEQCKICSSEMHSVHKSAREMETGKRSLIAGHGHLLPQCK